MNTFCCWIFIRVIIAFWSSSDVKDPQINIDFDFDSLFVLNLMRVATTRFSLINNEYRSRISNDFFARNKMNVWTHFSDTWFNICIVDLGHREWCSFSRDLSHHNMTASSCSDETPREIKSAGLCTERTCNQSCTSVNRWISTVRLSTNVCHFNGSP